MVVSTGARLAAYLMAFADGTDDSGVGDGIPTGSVPKWDGTSLVQGMIFSVPQYKPDGSYLADYVGIGTDQPTSMLDVRYGMNVDKLNVEDSITIAPTRRYYSLGPADFMSSTGIRRNLTLS